MYPKRQSFFTRQHIFIKEKGGAGALQSLAVSFIIRRRELNIKLLGDEVGQIFNFRISLVDGLQIVIIIGFLPKFFQRDHRSKNPDISQDVLDARLDRILDETLKAHKDQRDEVAPDPSIIFRSPKKLCNGHEKFSQGGKPLVRYRQLLGQIINGFHSLHKISVSTKSNQLGASEFFFSMSFYLLGPLVIRVNQYLHLFNIIQELLLISTEG
jgi:hypothetical protein